MTHRQESQTRFVRDRDYRLGYPYHYCGHAPTMYYWFSSLIYVLMEELDVCSVVEIGQQAARQGIVRIPAPSQSNYLSLYASVEPKQHPIVSGEKGSP